NRSDLIALIQSHDADALGVATHHTDFTYVCPVDHALHRDEHDVVAFAYGDGADYRPVAVARADVSQTFATTALLTVAHVSSILGGFGEFSFRRQWFLRARSFWLLAFRFGFGRLFASDVGAERRPLAVAVFTDCQQESFQVGHDHVDDFIAVCKR